MSGTVPITEVAQYMTWSLISWDYLITFDDELEDHTILVFKKIVDQVFILYKSLSGTHSSDFGYHLCILSDAIISGYWIYVLLDEVLVNTLCYLGTFSESLIYVTLQLFIIESILVLRIWAIMGKQRWILWTFFGLLACSTSTSIVISLYFATGTGCLVYGILTLIYETIIFISAAYYGIKELGGIRSLLLGHMVLLAYGPRPIMCLLFQVLVVFSILCSVPVMSFLDPHLGLTIMSVTMNHMLLGLQKQALSDSIVQYSQGVELTTFR
ncbi:uncharacterized protein EV420DRAFT_1482076 [Desarmillaria tabescens]|uniref:Uncharacterized protein n=1 Tax=Armillaria tabescens TaxID=1929756 RepID=A0AA39K1B0_ARMTA|nr:uncharacterized protein EV420DRAFT_1482076 [Desarmillaria tabescens]KAK0452767.1 hypothetical protein EV420DRAFT_1482076 [Desarmillaria tabescens]